MSWNYSGDPSDSPSDAVRFRITDTNEDDPLVTDEEIAYVLTLKGDNVGATAVFLCKQIALNFARQATAAERGRVREEFQERAQTFERLADRLAEDAGDAPTATAGIEAPSTTRSGVIEADSDADRTRGVFAIGMHDHPAQRPENDVYS